MNNTINNSIDVITSNAISIGDLISTNTAILPSAKEYREAAEKEAFQYALSWSEPKYQCPKCGGGMRKNMMVVLTSYPAQYEYQCDKCGYVDYQYM